MKTNSKIQAFTLSEIVVVLILTSIVIGLAFSILSLVQKQVMAIQKNFQKTTIINTLEQSLWIDFNRFPKITYNDFEDEIILKNEIDSIKYQFHDAYITKDLDTFYIEINNKALYFNGNTILKGDVDAIKLEPSKDRNNETLFIFKKNDATSFMN